MGDGCGMIFNHETDMERHKTTIGHIWQDEK
jgi:hypothetical protein